jgi:DNA repair protein SbcD/Mre11
MKTPIAIIFNDVHLKPGNEQETLDAVQYMLDYAVKHKIDKLIFAGDLFDSRSHQRQESIRILEEIIEKSNKAGCTLYMFPGNHDKTDYSSFYSFLEVYRYHPGVEFNRELKTIEIEGVSITLLPFFADDMLVPMIEQAEGSDVLISHFEMQGSTHLGRTSEKMSITKKMLKKWKKIYLGHYHNTHEISKDIVHLPSLRQDGFGEDDNKGFTLLYDDLSYEIVKGRFKAYLKVVVDIDKVSLKEVKQLIKLHSNSENTVRFEFTGEESKLKALDKSQFEGTGIDVKIKYQAVFEVSETEAPTLIKEYNDEQIYTSFEDFCEQKGYDVECGAKYLREYLESKKN